MRRIDLVNSRRWFFLGSGVAVALSLLFLAVFQLRPGIEFTSGTTMLIQFNQDVSQEDLRAVYADLGHPDARVQSTGTNEYLVRTRELEVPSGSFTEVSPDVPDDGSVVGPEPAPRLATLILGVEGASDEVALRTALSAECAFGGIAGSFPAGTEATVIEVIGRCPDGPIYRVTIDEQVGYVAAEDTHDFTIIVEEPESVVTQDAGERTVIEQRLFDEFGTFQVREFASVSAVVSNAAVRNAAVAVVVASLFIMAYVAFAFASLPRPFRYAVCTVVALAHDVIIVLGVFSLLGVLFGVEINLMFVTGLLTVVGFSVHDSIVVFDRARENIQTAPSASLAENMNSALIQTMSRSLNTSVTVVLTVAAMLALGGVTIHEFLLVILVGVIVGTYSSIGIASQLLVAWEEGDFSRLLARVRRAEPVAS